MVVTWWIVAFCAVRNKASLIVSDFIKPQYTFTQWSVVKLKAASQALEIVRWPPDFSPFVAGCLFFDIGRSPSDSPDLEQLWELAQRPPDGHRRTSGQWSAERSCQRPVFLGIIRRPSPGDLPMAVRAPGDLRAMFTNRSIAVRSPSGDLAATGRWSHNHRLILTPLPQIWTHV